MLSNVELIQTLDELEKIYQLSTTPRDFKMHAKHALLELCGWIEEAEDYIVLACANKLTDPTLKNIIADKTKFNSAFHFENNFVPLLSLVIGLTKFEHIKSKLSNNGIYFSSLVTTINSLKTPRNDHAHTHFESTKININNCLSGHAPSSLKQKANDLYLGFCELEKCLKKHRLI